MRIELRDSKRQRLGRIRLDEAARPTRVTTDAGREVFLAWDSAVDDAGRLRRCVACGCPELFAEKAFPQVTGIVVVLAFAGAIAGVLGYATNLPVLTAMTILLIADVGILLFSRRRLVCYRCRSSYHDLPIARYHRPWDRATAERHEPSRDEPDAARSTVSEPSEKSTGRSPGKPAAPTRRMGYTL